MDGFSCQFGDMQGIAPSTAALITSFPTDPGRLYQRQQCRSRKQRPSTLGVDGQVVLQTVLHVLMDFVTILFENTAILLADCRGRTCDPETLCGSNAAGAHGEVPTRNGISKTRS